MGYIKIIPNNRKLFFNSMKSIIINKVTDFTFFNKRNNIIYENI